MKSRFAILGMLVAGMVFSTAGAGLALQGQSGDNAAISQYATPTPTPPAEGGVLPAEEENAPPSENAPTTDSGGSLPAEESQPATQEQRQQAAAAQTSQLPFTGFAAIPVLLGGLALLAGGLVLRTRTRNS